jgi:hypothetical protein
VTAGNHALLLRGNGGCNESQSLPLHAIALIKISAASASIAAPLQTASLLRSLSVHVLPLNPKDGIKLCVASVQGIVGCHTNLDGRFKYWKVLDGRGERTGFGQTLQAIPILGLLLLNKTA